MIVTDVQAGVLVAVLGMAFGWSATRLVLFNEKWERTVILFGVFVFGVWVLA